MAERRTCGGEEDVWWRGGHKVERRTCGGEENMWWRGEHVVERSTCGGENDMSGEKDIMSQEEEGKKVRGERGGADLCTGGHVERRSRRTGLWMKNLLREEQKTCLGVAGGQVWG